MYPKHYFEEFWEAEQRNELFVCMPFDESLDARFNDTIKSAAIKAGFQDAVRVDEDKSGNIVLSKIWDGIANSRMVLADLSDDPRSKENHVNGNVLYEAGVAHAMREPEAVIIIRDQDPKSADFDVRGFTINCPPNNTLTEKWLTDLLSSSLENYKWSLSKRVKYAAESIDDIGLYLMLETGGDKQTSTHFNTAKMDAKMKLSVLRLLELGMLRFLTARAVRPSEHAYHWTAFGYAVMEYLSIPKVSKNK